MSDVRRWSQPLSVAGGVSFVAGSIDPMEGSVLILLGSALLALASYLGVRDRRVLTYRAWSVALVAIGVASLFLLSAGGGFGGSSGRSNWWALLILPYPIGWALDLWGPVAPRWMYVAGVAIGTWYLAILGMILRRAGAAGPRSIVPAMVLAVVGVATIAICAMRLVRHPRQA